MFNQLICLPVTSFYDIIILQPACEAMSRHHFSSILAVPRLFKDFGGEKNQDFMIIRCPISWFVYQWRHFTTSLRASTWGNVTTSFLPIYPFSQHVLFKKELFQFVCLVIDCCLDDRFRVINLFELLCNVLNIIYWFLWRASAPLSSGSSFIMHSVEKHDICHGTALLTFLYP